MKICFFGDTAAPHLSRWARYFAIKKYEVHILTFNSIIVGDYSNIKIHLIQKKFFGKSLLSRIGSVFSILRETKKLIKEIKPDIIHAHSAGGYAWAVMLTGFHPFVVTPWGNDVLIDVQKSKIEKLLTQLTLKKVDLITCDGENTKKAVIELGALPKKIRFVTFGVDIEKFKPCLKSEKEKLKQKFYSQTTQVVISTRYLTPVHDVETLIRAIPLVLRKNSGIRFIVIGGGPEKEKLINLAESLGVSNVVKFTGNISEEEMMCFLRLADVYCSTSLSESGLAASTAEAMACGLSVINTDTGDIKSWIKNGEGGFIIPVKNPEILAEKIIYLLNNVNDFGKFNRKTIEERNNYYKEMEGMENIYKKLI